MLSSRSTRRPRVSFDDSHTRVPATCRLGTLCSWERPRQLSNCLSLWARRIWSGGTRKTYRVGSYQSKRSYTREGVCSHLRSKGRDARLMAAIETANGCYVCRQWGWSVRVRSAAAISLTGLYCELAHSHTESVANNPLMEWAAFVLENLVIQISILVYTNRGCLR